MVVGRYLAGFVIFTASLVVMSEVRAVEIEIAAGENSYAAGTTLVSFLAPRGLDPTRRALVLMSENGQRVIAQRDVTSMSLLYWILEGPLAAGETRHYEISKEAVDEKLTDLVKCQSYDDDYELNVSGKRVMHYNVGVKPCPVEGFAACKRSGFIHPIYAPDGAVVSDDFPPEHPHQHGIMFAWVDAEFEGKTVDFWNSMKNQGIVEHVEVLGRFNGPVFGELEVLLRHSQLLPDGMTQPVIHELWRMRVYNSTEPFVIDLQSVILCATKSPLHLKEYHYGGMAFRGAREWSFGKAVFLTSEGKDRETGNHTRPQWTAITGQVGESNYTVCGVELPTNFRYPQPVRLHPDMPYFCWSPTVLGEFDITPEKPYVSHYRFFVFDGSPDKDELDELQVATVAPLMGKLVE